MIITERKQGDSKDDMTFRTKYTHSLYDTLKQSKQQNLLFNPIEELDIEVNTNFFFSF